MKIHQDNSGHMTKMAAITIYGAIPIYGKHTLKIFFLGNTGLILMKLCIKHQRPKPFMFCSNYNPWLTLSYFMARSVLQLRLLYGEM